MHLPSEYSYPIGSLQFLEHGLIPTYRLYDGLWHDVDQYDRSDVIKAQILLGRSLSWRKRLMEWITLSFIIR